MKDFPNFHCVVFGVLAFICFVTMTASSPLWAEELVGQRFSIRGVWKSDRLEATRLQERDSTVNPRNGQVEGRIDELDPTARTLRIGPVRIEWQTDTRFDGIAAGSLQLGDTVEVNGKINGPRRLKATAIERADPLGEGALKILGAVTEAKRFADGSMEFLVLGMPVVFSKATYNRVGSLTRRPDDRRPEDPFMFNLFGRPVTVGGEFESTWRYRGDYRFRDRVHDDESRSDNQFQLELFYPFAADYSLFMESKLSYEGRFGLGASDRRPEWALARGETWLYASDLFGSDFSLQVGRQDIREDREWWWDDDLDALRVHYDRRGFHAELAFAEEVAGRSTRERRVDPEEKNVFRLLGHTARSWARNQRLHAFVLFHNDHSPRYPLGQIVKKDRVDASDARLVWFGGRAAGKLDADGWGELHYSLDGARLVGQETLFDDTRAGGNYRRVTSKSSRSVGGWGLDGYLSWEMPLPAEPTLTLGYAAGSGDRTPEAGSDRAFRQTGLHANKGRYRGVNRFRYYGELLRPELSNLRIWTSALGFRFWRSSSVEFLYHYYRQIHAANFLRESSLRADPVGRRRSIGHEWDMVIGMREWKHVDLEVIGGFFRAGDAFGALTGKTAFTALSRFTYNF